MIQTLLSSGNFDDQCYLLKSFLSSTELKQHVLKLRIYQPEDEMKIKSFDNLAKVMSLSSPKKKTNITNEKNIFKIVLFLPLFHRHYHQMKKKFHQKIMKHLKYQESIKLLGTKFLQIHLKCLKEVYRGR